MCKDPTPIGMNSQVLPTHNLLPVVYASSILERTDNNHLEDSLNSFETTPNHMIQIIYGCDDTFVGIKAKFIQPLS